MRPTIVVPVAILARIRALRQRHLPAETGGFLLGLRRAQHLEVTGMTEQHALDFATPCTFERSDPGHAREIEAEWRRSHALVSVVGDWHSHPYGPATPSGADKKAWRVLARSTRQPVIGIIDAGDAAPSLYLVRDARFWTGPVALTGLGQEGADLAFVG